MLRLAMALRSLWQMDNWAYTPRQLYLMGYVAGMNMQAQIAEETWAG
jgi:hypothetical protein